MTFRRAVDTLSNYDLAWVVFSALAILLSVFWLLLSFSSPLQFDDAYMNYRYALHLREGLGLSWNPDGVPTYGLTSLLWIWWVLPASLLPALPGAILGTLSWCVGMMALAVMCLAISKEAESRSLHIPSYTFPLVATLLLLNPNFSFHLIWGMDTELSLLVNSILIYAILRYASSQDARIPYIIGLIAFISILTRPDNLICAFAAPLLMWFYSHRNRRSDLFGILLIPLLMVMADLLLNKYYFGVAFPLSLYSKTVKHFDLNGSLYYFLLAFTCTLPFLGALVVISKRSQAKFLTVFFGPVAATTLVLLFTNQVTGLNGRYYIPFIPFVVVPATLLIMESVSLGAISKTRLFFGTLLSALVMYSTLSFALGEIRPLISRSNDASPRMTRLVTSAPDPLPEKGWFEVIKIIGDDLVAHLPVGAKVAASEVGYIGAVAPRIEIIDVYGLNDTKFALNGFSPDQLFERAPDLIWLPHTGLRILRSSIFRDARLFEKYVVLAAFNYGIAIRKDSPFRNQIETDIASIWPRLYGDRKMSDYYATSAE